MEVEESDLVDLAFLFLLTGLCKTTTTSKSSRDLCLFVHKYIYMCVCVLYVLYVCLFGYKELR